MSGYRRVNYYELCRLCTSSEGNKMNIFREEGRRRQLQMKIQTYLSIQVLEEDSLPKIVCHECVKKLESFIEFRETVVSAEGMLESYFTSLRFSEDFLKEGKVYVKSNEKERPSTPEEDSLKSSEKVSSPLSSHVTVTEQQAQHQQPVVMSNVNASNIQIISGVQARVQQYKCAMQIPGGMAAAVVEATAETHYSYQQQTSQQISQQQQQQQQQQSNQTQNQITQQQNHQPQSTQIQQVPNQIQSQSQQVQPRRQITQQQSQPTQITQQNQSQMNQQQDPTQIVQQQSQSQITQQIQQLQRQQREYEKQQRQLQQIEKQQVHIAQQEQQQAQMVQHQDNNILKNESNEEQSQQVIQKIQSEHQENNASIQNVQTYTTVQASPEVLLSLGFKEAVLAAQTARDDTKDFKDFVKGTQDDGISRSSIGQISEFLRLRTGPEPTSLISVNPQVISQSTRNPICRDCGKTFISLNQLSGHNCSVAPLINDASEVGNKDDSTQISGNSFSCDVCGKPFKRKEHLLQHRKLHTGERPYVCTTCAKAFSRKEHLVRHSVSHTGQKMHECEMCGKSFSRKDNLHKHRKTHGVSGPYSCETCGKSFVVKHYYLMHLTTHAPIIIDGIGCQDPLPYKCDLCHKAFSVKQYLTTHKLRHKSKNNVNHANHSSNVQQQQPPIPQSQLNTTSDVHVTSNNVTNSANLHNSNVQTSNASVEIQSVIERNEQINSSFTNNQYHGSVQQFQ